MVSLIAPSSAEPAQRAMRETVSGGQQVCVREGLPGEGESCTDVCDAGLYCVEGECYQACQPGSSNECSVGRTCVEVDPDNNVGLCLEVAGPYDECFAEGQCPDNYICIGNGSTGTCAKTCDVCDLDCPANTNCVELQVAVVPVSKPDLVKPASDVAWRLIVLVDWPVLAV